MPMRAISARQPGAWAIWPPLMAALLMAMTRDLQQLGMWTDERGSNEYNDDLSSRRAAAVVAYLTARGTSADRLTSTGYGKRLPVDLHHNEDAWAARFGNVLQFFFAN